MRDIRNKGLYASLAAGAICVGGMAWAAQAADGRYTVLSQATRHDRLFSVEFDGDVGLASGEGGMLMRSSDGGANWTREQAPTELALIDAAMSGTVSIAVGQLGLILVRDGDGGWSQVDSGTDRRLLQVDLNRKGTAIVTGAFGTLLRSTDHGKTWTELAPDWASLYSRGQDDTGPVRDEPTNYVVNVAEDDSILIAGEYGQILRSVDRGDSWSVVYRHAVDDDEVPPTIFGMNIRPDGVGYAVGQAGLVLGTADAGRSWAPLKTPTEASLFGVDSFENGQIVVVGQRAALHSRDGGRTWLDLDVLDLNINWYAALGHGASAKPGEVVAVGHAGRILHLVP